MGFITEFLREFGLFIFYIIIAVCGVFAGKALKDRKLAKKAAEEAAEAEAALKASLDEEMDADETAENAVEKITEAAELDDASVISEKNQEIT